MAAIRGAACAENTAEDISANSTRLVEEILHQNGLCAKDVYALIFTCTDDLDACYPATAVRELLGDGQIAYMCLREMSVVGSLDHCIRVCVLTDRLAQRDCKHVYLGRATTLRPDLS